VAEKLDYRVLELTVPLSRTAVEDALQKAGAEGFHLTEVILGDRSVFLAMERRPGSDSIKQ
jgi:hypothetical protein